MLVKVELNLASRQLIGLLLGEVTKIDLTAARIIREVRRRFDIREGQREVEKLTREREEEVAEYQGMAKQITDPVERSLAMRDTPELLTWDDLMGMEARTFTIDDAHLKWVQDVLQGKDWGAPRPGQERATQLPAAMIEAIADLADALGEAKGVRDE